MADEALRQDLWRKHFSGEGVSTSELIDYLRMRLEKLQEHAKARPNDPILSEIVLYTKGQLQQLESERMREVDCQSQQNDEVTGGRPG